MAIQKRSSTPASELDIDSTPSAYTSNGEPRITRLREFAQGKGDPTLIADEPFMPDATFPWKIYQGGDATRPALLQVRDSELTGHSEAIAEAVGGLTYHDVFHDLTWSYREAIRSASEIELEEMTTLLCARMFVAGRIAGPLQVTATMVEPTEPGDGENNRDLTGALVQLAKQWRHAETLPSSARREYSYSIEEQDRVCIKAWKESSEVAGFEDWDDADFESFQYFLVQVINAAVKDARA